MPLTSTVLRIACQHFFNESNWFCEFPESTPIVRMFITCLWHACDILFIRTILNVIQILYKYDFIRLIVYFLIGQNL